MTNMTFLRKAAVTAALACMAFPLRTESAAAQTLGPADGRNLPAADTGRVRIGDLAPDFTLEALVGGTVTLSSFRGKKNVILQFYRGHW